MIKLGIIGTSKKQNERRIPVHPDHLQRIPQELRRQLIFEKGYGKPFDIPDSEIAALSSGITMDREELLSDIGNVIVAKPTSFDKPMLRVGNVDYYGVDHTPLYLWESASQSISAALIVYLQTILEGPSAIPAINFTPRKSSHFTIFFS